MREHRRCKGLWTALMLIGAISIAPAADTGRRLPDRYAGPDLDGAPVVVEHPVAGTTWAAWAYRNGPEYDIAVSVRDALGQWSEPRMFGLHDGLDQVDPDLVFDATGTAYLTFAVRETGEIHVALRVGGLPDWIGPQAIVGGEDRGSAPTVRIVGDRVVVAYRTEDGVDLLDFPLVRSADRFGTHGIQEGPDVIDPLGREMDTGETNAGEEAGTSDGTAWRNRPGTSVGHTVRSFRPRGPSDGIDP